MGETASHQCGMVYIFNNEEIATLTVNVKDDGSNVVGLVLGYDSSEKSIENPIMGKFIYVVDIMY